MKAILSKHLVILFLLAAGFLTFSAGVCYHAAHVLNHNQRRVTQTYEVLGNIEALKGAMWLAERDERNYVITGLPAWLDGYVEANREIDRQIGEIQQRTGGDSSAQQRRLAELRAVVAARMASLDDAVVAFHDGGIDASRRRIVEGSGPRLMERAVGILGEMEHDEERLLAARSAQSTRSLRSLLTTFVLVAVMSAGLLATIFLGVRREVAARAEAARQLKESEGRLLLAIEAAGLAIWEHDLRTGRVLTSERCDRLFGLPPGQPVTVEAVRNAVHPEDIEHVTEAIRRATDPAGRGDYAVEFRVVRPDGSVRWVRSRGRVLFAGTGGGGGAGRQPARVVATMVDVTDARRAEAELREARDRSDAANRTKDQFVAVLSHELRTPLTPVLATVSELERRDDLPPGVREDLATVRRNVEMEARLIDDLLDLTRIARGEVRLHPEVIDVHGLVAAVVEMFRAQAHEKSLLLTAEPAAERHHVWGDPGRLQQVLWNLVSNAIKFTPAGGEVRVRTADEDIQGRGARGKGQAKDQDRDASNSSSSLAPRPLPLAPSVLIEVTDTGIGIDAALLPRLFHAFEQAEQTIARRYGGLGLGLSIAKAITDLHGGTLDVSSPGRGKGTTFRLRLTTIDAPRPAPVLEVKETPATDRPKAPATPRLRVLLVEDNEDTRRLMGRLLRTFGHHVEAADTVAAAMDLAGRERFDLLVSDIGLPDGTGWDLMGRLGEGRPARAIAVSGFGMPEDIRRSKEAGFAEHVTKPINVVELRAVIERVMAGTPVGRA